jgi:hypothetical protein
MTIYNLSKANPFYQRVVDRITRKLEMNRIKVYRANVPNALATLFQSGSSDQGRPIIAYNPSFIKEVRHHSVWSMYFVFAHEVAHHYNQDLYGAFIGNGYNINWQSHRQEINADYFAGWVLRCEGASLKDSLEVYDIVEFEESYTHPSEFVRRQALINGWRDANCRMAPPKRIIRRKQIY